MSNFYEFALFVKYILTNKSTTHFSGKDRQMLTRIVERWGDLSDELKEAVLRVVG